MTIQKFDTKLCTFRAKIRVELRRRKSANLHTDILACKIAEMQVCGRRFAYRHHSILRPDAAKPLSAVRMKTSMLSIFSVKESRIGMKTSRGEKLQSANDDPSYSFKKLVLRRAGRTHKWADTIVIVQSKNFIRSE